VTELWARRLKDTPIGTCETPKFQRRNREFDAAFEASGKLVELLIGEHYNHFELPETLGNPYDLHVSQT
jgi:arylformamidase